MSKHEHKRDPPVPLVDKREAARRETERLDGVHGGGPDVGLLAVALEPGEAPYLSWQCKVLTVS